MAMGGGEAEASAEVSAGGRSPEDLEFLVNSFSDVTSASREETLFFLESHAWELDPAVESFFEDQPSLPPPGPPAPPVRPQPQPHDDDQDNDEDEEYVPSENEKKNSRRSAVTTISDLKRKALYESDSDTDTDNADSIDTDSDSDDDDDEEEFHNAPRNNNKNKMKSRMIRRDLSTIQRRNDADPDFDAPSQSKSKTSFTGKARLLSTQQPASSANDVNVELPRRHSSPASRPPRKRVMRNRAFRGTGRTIGTEPDQVPDEPAEAPAPAPAPTPASNDIPGFRVDESLPTTSLQIRLSDGTRLVARFNTGNTIGDLRAFIDASGPSGAGLVSSYQLQTVGFPPKPLNDVSKTIEEEGIANSVVIQKV